MKKLMFVIAFVMTFAMLSFAGGAYFGGMTADTNGATIVSKAQLTMKSVGDMKVYSSAGNSYYGFVSGSAGTTMQAYKMVVGFTPAKVAGLNVTLAAEAAMTDVSSMWVFATTYGSTQGVSPATINVIDGTHFTIYGDASSTYQYLVIGK